MDQVAAPLRPDNVIANKISAVLSASYTDASFRQALEALDSRVKVGENTVESRRHLRSNTEAEVIKTNGQVIKSFGRIAERVRSIGATVDSLNRQYGGMDRTVVQASRLTGQTSREAQELKAKLTTIEAKVALLQSFERTFVLSEDEIEVLTSVSRPIDDIFFDTLNKTKRIYANTQALLASENESSQSGGMEIMSAMSKQLDSAYDRLSYFVQRELKPLATRANMQLGPKLRRSLAVLASGHPQLFESALQSLTDARKKSLNAEFLNALTTETTNSKPIDFYAYDVLRYVGDMMAWIHSASINEQENLDALFQTDTISAGIAEGLEAEPWWWEGHSVDDVKSIVSGLVDKTTATLVRPLQLRVEQALSTEPKATTIYQVSNVLVFYRATFTKQQLAPPESALMTCLDRLEATANRQFTRSLQDRITAVKDGNLEVPALLGPPEFLTDAMTELKAMLTSYESSIAYATPESESGGAIRQIVEDMVEPYLEICNRLASDMANEMDMAIFQVNCFDAVKMSLLMFSSLTVYKLDQLEGRIEELAGALAARQYRSFVAGSGLHNWQQRDLADRTTVQEIAQKLDDFLPAATMESNVALQRLSSPRLGSTITLRASQQFADTFAEVRAKLLSIYGDGLGELFPRTEEEVGVLLAT